jgi:hypothetical protein
MSGALVDCGCANSPPEASSSTQYPTAARDLHPGVRSDWRLRGVHSTRTMGASRAIVCGVSNSITPYDPPPGGVIVYARAGVWAPLQVLLGAAIEGITVVGGRRAAIGASRSIGSIPRR